MVGRREPLDRVVDLLVAAPTCTFRAARRAAPLFVDVVRRGLSAGPPHDHRDLPTTVSDEEVVAAVAARVVTEAVSEAIDEAPQAVRSLAIEDYDHLAARQVVDRLGGLDPRELDAVEEYERAHRHRQTILRRIEQLRT